MEKRELAALVSLLEDDDREIIAHVEKKLLSLDIDVIPALEKEWMNNSLKPLVRIKIEDIIHSLQYKILKQKLTAWKKNGAEDLLEGMMLISNYQYPDLNMKYLKRKFEHYHDDARREFQRDMGPIEQIKVLNDVMFNKLKFRPNSRDFHAPSNSMINVVMDSKKGNPLSLCVIYMIIAQRLKLPVYGVNLPNLFVLTYKSAETQFYINVFNKGLIFSTDDIDNYIQQLNLSKSDVFYQPCHHIDIAVRNLRNLIGAFDKLGEHKKSDDLKELLKALEPDA